VAVFKTLLFNEGEGLSHDDLNNAQRFLQASAWDALLRQRLRQSENSLTTAQCYSLGVGANIVASITALRSTNDPGVIAQLTASTAPTGNDPMVLVYYLADGELQTDHVAAHATLERWDIVCVKLSQVDGDPETRDFEDAATRAVTSMPSTNKRRNVTLTKQVVQGTNAAVGTAVEPAVPAGFVKWAAVKISPAYASAFQADDHFRDYRVPLGGYQCGLIAPHQLEQGIGAAFGSGLNTCRLIASAASQFCYAYIPIVGSAARLMKLTVRSKITGGGSAGAVRLERLEIGLDATLSSSTIIKDFGHTSGVEAVTSYVDNGLTSDTLVGPIWGRGQRCGPATNNVANFLRVAFRSGAANDYVSFIHYEVAGP
jgi:hypothetical protein